MLFRWMKWFQPVTKVLFRVLVMNGELFVSIGYFERKITFRLCLSKERIDDSNKGQMGGVANSFQQKSEKRVPPLSREIGHSVQNETVRDPPYKSRLFSSPRPFGSAVSPLRNNSRSVIAGLTASAVPLVYFPAYSHFFTRSIAN